MKQIKYTVLLVLLILAACSTVNTRSALKDPVTESFIPIENYELALIPLSEKMRAPIGSTIKYLKPDEAIAGVLLKKGITRLTNVPDKNKDKDKTVLVTWGISGSRNIGFNGAYSQEVTILIRQLNNLEIVYKCTAEGIGETEVDDIRNAIYSCLSGL